MMEKIKQILVNKFGFTNFKPGQEEVVNHLLNQKDTLAILPTATGKSLTYQLTSYCLPGVTLVVSPLISLMEDQVQQLAKIGEKNAVAINSLMDFHQRKFVLKHIKRFKFIFVSPELLANQEVLTILEGLSISLLVVDEAHCISQWGNDFRPDYLNLRTVKNRLNHPLTLALTATATSPVIKDIEKQLFGNEFEVVTLPIDRENIFLSVVNTEDKLNYLIDFLNHHHGPGIIYFSSKAEAESIASELNQLTSLKIGIYHGDVLPEDRIKIQQQFLKSSLQILCATNAFGMGINKADIRFVIHYHLPDSLENYVQEFGRAGRDGLQSVSIILYQEGDERIHRFLHDDSFQQKSELLSLKHKTRQEMKTIYLNLSDLQKKWLVQIANTDWDWDNFEKQLQNRKTNHFQNIVKMMDYIRLTTCRRNFILEAFDNQNIKTEEKKQCCDLCNNELPDLTEVQKVNDNEENLKTAEQIIRNLFLL